MYQKHKRSLSRTSFQSLTIITKRSILDVAAVLDPPLNRIAEKNSTNKTSLCPYEVAICSRSSMHEKKVSSSLS